MKNKNLSSKQKVTYKPQVKLRQLSVEEMKLVIGGATGEGVVDETAADPDWVPWVPLNTIK